MLRKVEALTVVTAAAMILLGCASSGTQLNDPSRSMPARDVANILSPRDIPYETIEKDGIAVSYNLFHTKSSNLAGYRLTLILKNNTSSSQILRPVVSIQEANGLLIQPYAYDAFVSQASSLAGTVVPAMPAQNQSDSYYTNGTIRNTMTGATYDYSSTTTSRNTAAGSFASGLAQGLAQGATVRAANDREEGHLMLRWANAFWLRSSYTIPSGAAASGALFFPASSIGQSPLRLTVEVNDRVYVFTTATK